MFRQAVGHRAIVSPSVANSENARHRAFAMIRGADLQRPGTANILRDDDELGRMRLSPDRCGASDLKINPGYLSFMTFV
jgi:hypothetical protein